MEDVDAQEKGRRWRKERVINCDTQKERRQVNKIFTEGKTTAQTNYRLDQSEAIADIINTKGGNTTKVLVDNVLRTVSLRILGHDMSRSELLYRYELKEWFGIDIDVS